MSTDPSTGTEYFYAVNSSTHTGPWKPTPSSQSGSGSADWLTANLTGANASPGDVSLLFHTSISLEGNYSVIMYTPGCRQMSDCGQRGIVNVTWDLSTLSYPGASNWTQISQTNDFDKYDLIYFGPVNVSTDLFEPTVGLANMAGSGDNLVAQKVGFL